MQLLNMEKQITSLLLANNLPIFDPFCLWVSAERAGFEPAKPFRGLHAFQACLFNHSSISPFRLIMYIKKQPASIKRKKQLLLLSAEKEGFEPPEPLSSTVFKTAAIDHSAISPCL